MNERIKELAAQATKFIDPIDPQDHYEIFDKEKFVELLILECAPFVGDPDSEAVEKMMKHFGVNDESSRRNKRGLV